MNRVFIAVILLFFKYAPAFQQVKTNISPKWDENIESILQRSGKNRLELEKALKYFKQSSDSLKYKAICFLVENMDIHYSVNYYWADSLERPVPYSELTYPSFEESLKAFEELKNHTPKIHPVPVKYYDIDSIKGDFLIDNVERAFDVWKRPWAKQLSFSDFCEFILPYRAYFEPLQNWRKIYQEHFAWVTDSVGNKSGLSAMLALNNNLKTWYVSTWGEENRKEPLPLLGPLQLLHREQGLCQDAACLGVYAMRSQGIPSCMEIIPYWGTTANRHFWNVTLDENLQPKVFEAGILNPEEFKLKREPSKVIRITYAKQPGTLASLLPTEQVPDGPMRSENIKDVTALYWPVKDIECELFPLRNPQKAVYACVLNYGSWRAAWWGKVEGNKAVFKQMSRGVVYLPMYYINGKLRPAGYPVALGYSHEKVLVPDKVHKHRVVLPQQDKYLVYRTGKLYRLYYWDTGWRLVGEKKIEIGMYELAFENVPRNALLRLIPEYASGMERPFIITDEGERIWW